MREWIRWKGVIAFIAVAGLISIFWFLLVDLYVEHAIEKTGTAIVGAKVELDSADLSLIPLGLTLHRLQITKPDEPLKNAIEVKRIAFRINSLNLLRRKIIIEEMATEGIQLGTHRKTSGALHKAKPKEAPQESKLARFSANLPDVKGLLEKENLESVKLANSLKEEMQSSRSIWEKKLTELPGKEKIETYKKRIAELRSKGEKGMTGMLGTATEVAALKNEIEADIKLLNDAQSQYGEKLATFNKQMSAVLKAPENDLKRLKEKYGLTSEGFGSYSHILFGEKVGRWTKQIIYWHKKIEPLVEHAKAAEGKPSTSKPIRAKGVDVHFVERQPLPDFLIKLINASVSLKAGDLSGKIMNITTEQSTLGIPLTFAFAGEKLHAIDSVRFEGNINHINPLQSKDTIKLALNNYKITEHSLIEGEMPIKINAATASISLDTAISGEKIDAAISGNLKALKLSAGKDGETDKFRKILASALQEIKEISFTVKIKGDVDNYSVDITSDAENIIKKAFKDQFGKLAESWEKELASAVKDKTGVEIQGLKTGLANFSLTEGELKGRNMDMNSLLKELVPSGKPNLKLPF